jgi:L-aminopeptidase/D-esterase-like protein
MITEVSGVLVGQRQRAEPATGVTVVLTPEGATGAVDLRGATGTRETDLLDPANLVHQVHGICLAGGGSFGLAAADGVVRWLAEQERGFPVGVAPGEIVPIVPAATLTDLPVSRWRAAPDADSGYAACEAATKRVDTGRVGAGAGADGLGSASAIQDDWTVGALTVLGAGGLAVVAVDVELSKADCRRLTLAGQDGLARTGWPGGRSHGVTVFALATGVRSGPVEALELDRLCAVAADVVQRAAQPAVG